MTCSADNPVQAYDGGQAHIMRLGEVQTARWQIDGIEVTDTLSSAGFSVSPAVGLSLVQTSIDTVGVNYQMTASTLGEYDLDISLTGASGDVYKKRLTVLVDT